MIRQPPAGRSETGKNTVVSLSVNACAGRARRMSVIKMSFMALGMASGFRFQS
jgi:hypothetical protein